MYARPRVVDILLALLDPTNREPKDSLHTAVAAVADAQVNPCVDEVDLAFFVQPVAELLVRGVAAFDEAEADEREARRGLGDELEQRRRHNVVLEALGERNAVANVRTQAVGAERFEHEVELEPKKE